MMGFGVKAPIWQGYPFSTELAPMLVQIFNLAGNRGITDKPLHPNRNPLGRPSGFIL
ncbi:MAG: hypothetical protein ACXWIU_15985 [Limisphaerales bacterium]